MAQVFRKNTPKMVLGNNDLYNTEKIENHHYEELQEKDNRLFFNIKMICKIMCKVTCK